MRWRSADLPRSFGSCMIGPSVKKIALSASATPERAAGLRLHHHCTSAVRPFLVETAGK
nr:MAG TPA: hypothetical protein [Bacteriophage sp.]